MRFMSLLSSESWELRFSFQFQDCYVTLEIKKTSKTYCLIPFLLTVEHIRNIAKNEITLHDCAYPEYNTNILLSKLIHV